MTRNVWWKTTAAIVGLLLSCWGLYFVLDQNRLNGDALGVVGGLTAAAFTAIAAVAALGAARESSATARDAREALGLAMKPVLDIEVASWFVGGPQVDGEDLISGGYEEERVSVVNKSSWVATDVEVSVALSDGRTGRHRFDRVEPPPPGHPEVPPTVPLNYFALDKGSPQPWDDLDWRGDIRCEDIYTVAFSDERGLLRWQKKKVRIHTHSNDGFVGGSSEGWHVTEERLR